MLVVGQKEGKYYESSVSDEHDSIDYSTIAQDFHFILISNTIRQDYTGRIGKPVRTVVIRSSAGLPFKEDDRIEWDGKNYKIVDVPETTNSLTSKLTSKVITMVG